MNPMYVISALAIAAMMASSSAASAAPTVPADPVPLAHYLVVQGQPAPSEAPVQAGESWDLLSGFHVGAAFGTHTIVDDVFPFEFDLTAGVLGWTSLRRTSETAAIGINLELTIGELGITIGSLSASETLYNFTGTVEINYVAASSRDTTLTIGVGARLIGISLLVGDNDTAEWYPLGVSIPIRVFLHESKIFFFAQIFLGRYIAIGDTDVDFNVTEFQFGFGFGL